jgi:hypothetical protein
MKTIAGQIIAPALFALLASGGATADPRDIAPLPEPLTPEEREARRVQQVLAMDPWLRTLEGRFRIEGVKGGRSATGKADCISIGPGAGIQCVVFMVWDEQWDEGQAGLSGVSSLAPAVIQYGLDPAAVRIRSLRVDNRSLAEPATGLLKGDTTTFQAHCPNTPAYPPCTEVTRIHVPPGADYIQMSIDTDSGAGSVQMSSAATQGATEIMFGDKIQNPFPSISSSAGDALDLYWYRVARDATDEEFNQPLRRGPGGPVQWPKVLLRPHATQ